MDSMCNSSEGIGKGQRMSEGFTIIVVAVSVRYALADEKLVRFICVDVELVVRVGQLISDFVESGCQFSLICNNLITEHE